MPIAVEGGTAVKATLENACGLAEVFVIDGQPRVMAFAFWLHETWLRCHRHSVQDRRKSAPIRRISAANFRPHRFHRSLRVSCHMFFPRSCSGSSRYRKDGREPICSITIRWMISGLVLKYLKETGLVIDNRLASPPTSSSQSALAVPFRTRSGLLQVNSDRNFLQDAQVPELVRFRLGTDYWWARNEW